MGALPGVPMQVALGKVQNGRRLPLPLSFYCHRFRVLGHLPLPLNCQGLSKAYSQGLIWAATPVV